MKIRKLCFYPVLLVVALLGINVYAENEGLAGVLYDSSDYTDARQTLLLRSLDKTWSESNHFGKGWAAKWQGFIVGPVTGQVHFTGSTDQEFKILIDGNAILDSKHSVLKGTVPMVQGRRYPIVVSYAKSGSEYDCNMKVHWSWATQSPTAVSGKALAFTDKIKAKTSNEVEIAKKAKMRTFEDSPEHALLEDKGKPYMAKWSSLMKHNAAPDWFRDAKFGIYFHWGVYSVPGFGYGSDWYASRMSVKGRPEYEHHVKTYGHPSKFGYHEFVPMFKAEKFDPEEWADLFAKAGARFAGPVAEHHDGFAMWASRLTPWNVKDMGPKRDTTGEIAKAIRKRGMRLITTFHHARNNQRQIEKNGKLVWTGFYPHIKGWPTASEDPKLRMLYGNIPREQFLELWQGKIIEVIDNYLPDIIWFESDLYMIPDKYVTELLAHYFNKADENGKEVVVTYKETGLPPEIGVEDFEMGRENHITKYAWLTDDTIATLDSKTWGYASHMKIKSTPYLIHVLIDIVSKNGQLVLNISPMGDGSIPDNQRQALLGIGAWLGKYGEAIYGTRPFIEFAQGPTRLQTGGEYAREQLQYKSDDIRFTTKGDTVYAIGLGWPGANHETLLEAFSTKRRKASLKIKSVTMLGTDEKIEWSLRDDGLAVTTPSLPPDKTAIVYKIQTNGIEHFKSRKN
ncbi:MAG: alpha-L-fucosidase [Planctomycetota bacterium]|jgi:alpha-L-fucosidase